MNVTSLTLKYLVLLLTHTSSQLTWCVDSFLSAVLTLSENRLQDPLCTFELTCHKPFNPTVYKTLCRCNTLLYAMRKYFYHAQISSKHQPSEWSQLTCTVLSGLQAQTLTHSWLAENQSDKKDILQNKAREAHHTELEVHHLLTL